MKLLLTTLLFVSLNNFYLCNGFQELVVALQNMVIVFENSFLSAAFLEMKEGNQVALASGTALNFPYSIFYQ